MQLKKLKMLACSALVASGMALASAPVTASAQDPFLGEIKWVGFNFAPRGWAFCDGQLLPISQNQALFSLLGTSYGGDGRTTFGLPDLRSRSLVHAGQGPGLPSFQMGQKYGNSDTTLNVANMPSHNHPANATGSLHGTSQKGNSNAPGGKLLANDGADRIYRNTTANNTMSSQAISVDVNVLNAGNSQSFNQYHPVQGARCIIALQGIFPSRN